MLKIFLIFMLILKAVTAFETCESCDSDAIPLITSLETDEDLQNLCKPGIEYLKCEVNNYDNCENRRRPFDTRSSQAGYNLLATVKEICSEDTLLNAVIVENLKCYSKLIHEANPTCIINESALERGQQFADILHEEGLRLPFENDTSILHQCLGLMNFFACQSIVIEKRCGTVAMKAVVEILQKAGPGVFYGCEEFYQYLPGIVRFRREEEDKRRQILEDFINKK